MQNEHVTKANCASEHCVGEKFPLNHNKRGF